MLSKNVIEGIRSLVNKVKSENHIVNEIIRDDVFEILQACNCTVLYYPLENENGDGEDTGCAACHLEMMIAGKMEQLVFINSHNTKERQAFSAAHELGHIWKVDEQLKEMFPKEVIDDEEAINRFAAELLMPQIHFNSAIQDYLTKTGYKGPKMPLADMLRLVAYLMNCFFVPYRSVVKRLIELGRLKEQDEKVLLEYKNSNYLADIIKTEQYNRLRRIDDAKSMDNLQEYLAIAEKFGLVNRNKICNIRKDFGILTSEEDAPSGEVNF